MIGFDARAPPPRAAVHLHHFGIAVAVVHLLYIPVVVAATFATAISPLRLPLIRNLQCRPRLRLRCHQSSVRGNACRPRLRLLPPLDAVNAVAGDIRLPQPLATFATASFATATATAAFAFATAVPRLRRIPLPLLLPLAPFATAVPRLRLPPRRRPRP